MKDGFLVWSTDVFLFSQVWSQNVSLCPLGSTRWVNPVVGHRKCSMLGWFPLVVHSSCCLKTEMRWREGSLPVQLTKNLWVQTALSLEYYLERMLEKSLLQMSFTKYRRFFFFREFCQTRRMRSQFAGGSRTCRPSHVKRKPGLDSGELQSHQCDSSSSSRWSNLCFSTLVVFRGVRVVPVQRKTKVANGRVSSIHRCLTMYVAQNTTISLSL